MILRNNKVVEFGKFPNGEVNLRKFTPDPQDLTHAVTLKYEGDEDLYRLLLVKDQIDDAGVTATLRILYTPYSRMDRDSDTYVFSLKVFAKFINAMGWEKVVLYEPHSDVTPALFDRVQVVQVTTGQVMLDEIQYVVDILSGNGYQSETEYQVCYPDVGAFKRYSDKFKTGDPLIGFKVRDFVTGRIQSLDVRGEKTRDIAVIVDDLCSKGGTFIMAATKLREMGFKKIVLAIAHTENTVYSGDVLRGDLIDVVITTDSILNDLALYPDKLAILPMSEFRWT